MLLKYTILYIILLLSNFELYSQTEYNLTGKWQYTIINSEKAYPVEKTTKWKSVKLPNRNLFTIIAEKNKITKGYVLFRKKFNITSLPSEKIVFQIGEVMNVDLTYINGKQIGKTGLLPPEFKSAWAKFRNYKIPVELLQKGQNTIDIITYFNAELWILSPIRIIDEKNGCNEHMLRDFLQINFPLALFILLISFSTLFLLIYLKRKDEIMYLYYTLTTFFLADMAILQFIENIYPYIPLTSNTIFKICAIGAIFFPPFLTFFFRSYLGLKVSRRRLLIYLFLPLLITTLMLISIDRYYIIFWRNIFLLLIPLYMIDIIIVSLTQLKIGNKKGLTLFISLIPILILGIYDILIFSLQIFEGSIPLYTIGIPFMLLVIGLHLVNRFIYNLNATEKLNKLLLEKIEKEKRLASLDKELSIARKIQLATVPKTLPELKEFEIAVKYIPAENISGDFYNFHTTEDNKLGILIADVSGHGVPASLIASMVKVLFSTLSPVYTNPNKFIKGLNDYLFDKMEGNFLTAGYCYIDKTNKKAIYARAGHEPLFHLFGEENNVQLTEYLPKGRAVGFMPDINPELLEFDIAPGDRIILYTDALTEAFNYNGKMYGHERLKNLLISSKKYSAEESAEHIYNSIKEWSSQKIFEDDFTLIIIDIT